MKFRVWQEFGVWWVEVPPRMVFERESQYHHRSTFPEIVKLMDFYIGRARARVLRVVR